jgi:DNA-binding CsgD family transcriptional regulator
VLEREEELLTADSALRAAERGAGSVLVIDGPAGIGKTSLLAAIAHRAERRQVACVWATGGEREQDLEWSVVKSLFAGVVEKLSESARGEVERGAARLALPLVGGHASAGAPADQGALLYALYWLVVGLAAEAPLLLCVDDAHWADEASLRWLEYLGARISEVGVVLAVGHRTDATPIELQALAAHPSAQVLEPAPLSGEACACILGDRLARAPDKAFVDACCELTGGNPFLLGALVNWLRAQGVEPAGAQVPRLAEARPGEIERWTTLRLQALAPPALDVARAAAILGGQATLGRVSALAGVGLRDGARAAATLDQVGFLDEGFERPTLPLWSARRVRFAHPLLGSVIYDSIPAFARTALHTEAALLLRREGASAVAVAHQLMFTEPASDAEVVEILRAAAAQAMASGSPVTAAARLTRALAEPPAAAEVTAVLHELGRAEGASALPDAVEHLERAYAKASTAAQRGLIAEDLGLCLINHGRLEDSARLVRATLTELYDHAGELQGDGMLRLGAMYVNTSSYLRRGSQARAWLASLGAAPAAATPGGRLLLGAYSQQEVTSGESAASASEIAASALDGGRLLDDEGPVSLEFWSAVYALVFGCRFAAADEAIRAAADVARRCGSSYGYAMALVVGGLLAHRRGRLSDAVTDPRLAMAILDGEHVAVVRDYAVAFLAHALVDTGDLDPAARELDALPLDDPPELAPYAVAVAARGRLRLIRGDAEGALADQLRVESLAGMERLSPAVWPWRGQAALALIALDRRREAARLAAEEVELAERSGSEWAEGLALHAAGMVAGGAEGSTLLERAADRLRSVDAVAEHARVLIDLGSMAEAAGASREQAVDWLRRGLDLADRCNAKLLTQRAHASLSDYGVRPRRRRLSGAEALTPMERRVAERAASGMSNREIAQSFFLSLRTVESHLTSAYRKLQIESRANLAAALFSDRVAVETAAKAQPAQVGPLGRPRESKHSDAVSHPLPG